MFFYFSNHNLEISAILILCVSLPFNHKRFNDIHVTNDFAEILVSGIATYFLHFVLKFLIHKWINELIDEIVKDINRIQEHEPPKFFVR